MSENLQKFLEYASQSEDVEQKLTALERETSNDTAIRKTIEIAKEAGFTLSAEDFEEKDAGEELSDDELEAVAGGKACVCALGGGGERSYRKNQQGYFEKIDNKTCACVACGGGSIVGTDVNGYKTTEARCFCAVAGVGKDYWNENWADNGLIL